MNLFSPFTSISTTLVQSLRISHLNNHQNPFLNNHPRRSWGVFFPALHISPGVTFLTSYIFIPFPKTFRSFSLLLHQHSNSLKSLIHNHTHTHTHTHTHNLHTCVSARYVFIQYDLRQCQIRYTSQYNVCYLHLLAILVLESHSLGIKNYVLGHFSVKK